MYPSITADPNVEGRLYLASDVAGMWRSDDRGENWYFINEGLPNLNVACIAAAPSDSNVVYAGTSAGLARSRDAGLHWEAVEHEKIRFKKPASVKSIAVSYSNEDHVYAGSSAGVFYASEGGGRKWKELGSFEELYGQKAAVTFVFITPDGSHLLAGSKLGLSEYSFEAEEWKKLDPAGEGKSYPDGFFDKVNRAFFTVSGKKVVWSEDHGKTWMTSNEIPKKEISRIAVVKGAESEWVFLAGWKDGWKGGVLLSTDSGKSWKDIEKNLSHAAELNPTREWIKDFARPNFVAIDPFNPEIFYYTDSWGVWRSDDAGESWKEIINGAPNMTGEDLIISEAGTLLVSTMDDGLLKSPDGGKTWQAVLPKAGLSAGTISGHYWRIALLGEKEFVTTVSPWHKSANEIFKGNYETRDYSRSTEGLPGHYPKKNTFWGKGYPRALKVDPNNGERLYLGIDGDDGGGFYFSEDGGISWERPREQPAFTKIYNGLDVDAETGRIYWAACGKRGGIYTADAAGANWKERYFGGTCFFDLISMPGGKVFASGTKEVPVIYASEDHGEHWKLIHKFTDGAAAEALAADPLQPQNLFAGLVNWGGSPGGKVMHSPDYGGNWRDISGGLPENSGPAAMIVNPSDKMLYLLLYAGGVYKRPLDSIYGSEN